MNWAEVNIYTTSEGVEIVSGILMCRGINGFVIKDSKDFQDFLDNKTENWDYIDDDLMGLKDCETTVTVYLPENEQGSSLLLDIKEELKALKLRDVDDKFGRLDIILNNVNDQDWANNWKKYFKPLKIGEKLLIKPSWEEVDNSDNRKVLEIDPASSFGTGQHNTTQLCLELIEKYTKNGDRMLDLGCGSGILSIGGVLLGVSEVVAVDIEQHSVDTAIENALKNNISNEIYKGFAGNITNDDKLVEKIGIGYNIVCANIVADVLIAMSPFFDGFLKDNGVLVLSGIISQRRDEVVSTVCSKGFVLVDEKEKQDWIAVAFKKN